MRAWLLSGGCHSQYYSTVWVNSIWAVIWMLTGVCRPSWCGGQDVPWRLQRIRGRCISWICSGVYLYLSDWHASRFQIQRDDGVVLLDGSRSGINYGIDDGNNDSGDGPGIYFLRAVSDWNMESGDDGHNKASDWASRWFISRGLGEDTEKSTHLLCHP